MSEGFLAPVPYVPLPARVAVLLSGRGSNFEALADACGRGEVPARIALVLSDRGDAPGLGKAASRGIPACAVDPGAAGGRVGLEARFEELLGTARADVICLAGYMRILSRSFVQRHALRILNIHPSLLPAFPGLEAQSQALRYGVRVSGATVHLVDAGTDTGPIVEQETVPVLDGDDVASLSARILVAEHRLYPSALRTILEGGWVLRDRILTRKNPTFEGLSAGRPRSNLS